MVVMRVFLKNTRSMITTDNGYNAEINAPMPLGMFFKASVAMPFAETKSNTAIMASQANSFPVGSFSPFARKKETITTPAMNCLMEATSRPGTF